MRSYIVRALINAYEIVQRGYIARDHLQAVLTVSEITVSDADVISLGFIAREGDSSRS